MVQAVWDEQVERDCREIVRLAVREDLGAGRDWTSLALVPEGARAEAAIVARRAGIVAGLPAARLVLEAIDPQLQLFAKLDDGEPVAAGGEIGRLVGPARSLLAAERLVLNFIGRLSGVATLTRRYVERVAGTKARIYDTRKTTPGWRRLEKYAVRAGGGCNHRLGLFDAVLIKDNHLALGAAADAAARFTPAEAVRRARALISQASETAGREWVVEIEVDTLEQLDEVLVAEPDLVLLDNMPPAALREAVARRDRANPQVLLEASGGVDLQSVRQIAETGVDRISVGALTHAASWLDVGLDWRIDQTLMRRP